jgi:threonine aldolase
MNIFDLRSDTVTQPNAPMREAMLNAPLGDDVFGEDPTVNALQEKAARMFGKEAALFCSSGTQTNQIAINVHTHPGDEVICSNLSHIYLYEGGGVARNSGVSMRLLEGDRGRITAVQVRANMNNPKDVHLPLTRLVSLEDTVNKGGGAIYDFHEILEIRETCNELGLPLHLDGARVFNSLVATDMNPKDYGDAFDSISICLSKGLGAPVGSLLLGTNDFIEKARRVRKVFGGGMRQAGILAAAGIYALENNVTRLVEDHQRAKELGAELVQSSWVKSVMPVDTNIVIIELANGIVAASAVEQLAVQGVKCFAFGADKIRWVTHLDYTAQMHEQLMALLPSLHVK